MNDNVRENDRGIVFFVPDEISVESPSLKFIASLEPTAAVQSVRLGTDTAKMQFSLITKQ